MKKNINPEITAGQNTSYWTSTAPSPATNPLKENLKTEVVIVGGGLAGLSTAYCLSQAGKQVVVVEDGNLGSGETGRTTAHLVTALDHRYYDLEKTFGEEKTKLVAESHHMAIDFVEKTIQKEKIECGFERLPGYLFQNPSDKGNSLEKELAAATKAGLNVKIIDNTPGIEGRALCFYDQAQFHPLLYIEGLSRAIQEKGGKIFTGTHAAKIDHEGITTTDGFEVKADHVVVATNSPVNNLLTMFVKQYAYRTYVIGALIPKDSLPKALWWDTGDFGKDAQYAPYHYFRTQSYDDQHDLLIAGGEDHPTGTTEADHIPEENRYKLLEDWTKQYFSIKEIKYRWSGQVLEPMDGISFIGRNPLDHSNVYIITGDSGIGMTHCTFGSLLITDLILGKENKWEKLYNPNRFTLSEAGSALALIKEDVIYLLKKWFYTGSVELDSIKNGEAGIVKLDGKKCGVYRDEIGKLFMVSAECTHLKCMVVWNNDEKTWDCPCHGSRFSYDGKVMNGPANSDLPSYSGLEMA